MESDRSGGNSAVMAKGKKTTNPPPPQPPDDDDGSVVLYIRMPPAVQQALADYIRSDPLKPKRQRVGLEALVEFLEAKGFWPPKSE
jgi:hypothetical protein